MPAITHLHKIYILHVCLYCVVVKNHEHQARKVTNNLCNFFDTSLVDVVMHIGPHRQTSPRCGVFQVLKRAGSPVPSIHFKNADDAPQQYQPFDRVYPGITDVRGCHWLTKGPILH